MDPEACWGKRAAGSEKQGQSAVLSAVVPGRLRESMGIPRTACGCAGLCGCICYLTETAASSSSLSDVLIVINAITWRI